MLRRVMRFCSRLYQGVINGKLYENYLEGLKEAIKEDMSDTLFKNKTLQEKYLEYIEYKLLQV